MNKKELNITYEELSDFMRQIEGIKSTIEILQSKGLMEQINESETLERMGSKLIKVNI
ncbi:MAG: hypothetical protein NUV46_00990 [Nanoarchaeota archaeon]|nr:hypothetical protein [Nanoarchaeota archaeon]